MQEFLFRAPTRIIGGEGSLDRLAGEISAFPRNCLIVSGRRSARLSGLLERVIGILDKAKVESKIFDQIEPNPTLDTIQDGAELARSQRARWVLGIGGGSALDASKAIALMTVNQAETRDFFKRLKPENDPLPVVAIPTTSGTGSEVTPYAILTDVQAGDKYGIALDTLFPRVAILEPSATVSMPEAVTVDTGLDALCHAIESCFAKTQSRFTDLLVGDAIRRIREHLPLARAEPENLVHRTEMQLAATEAGLAIANTGTLVPHALGYPVTVAYDMTHGRATVLLLPAFLEKIEEVEPERVSFINRLIGGGDTAAESMRAFIESLGVAPRLGAYGMRDEDIEHFCELAIGKKHLEKTPGEWPKEALEEIYRNSF